LTQVDGAEVREALQLERQSFVDLALLCGTDFSQRLKNIGPFTALKLIKEHHSIEALLQNPTMKLKLPSTEYMQEIAAGRLIFDAVSPLPDEGLLKQGEFDRNRVQEILENFGLGRASTGDSSVDPLERTFDDIAPPGFVEIAFQDGKSFR